MFFLRQSTAVTVPVGGFWDKTDGVTPESGEAGTMSVYLHKNGGNPAVRSSATAITYPTNAGGHYSIPLDTTDTNTLGTLRLHVTNSATHLGVWEDYMVMNANAWDSLFGTDKLQVDVAEMAANVITASALAADAVTEIWTTTLTEAYAADGAAATPAQLLYMLLSALAEFGVAGTTITCRKIDGSTTAMTYTINDATNPTSRTRAT